MQAYVSAPRLTINVVRRTTTCWDTLLKMWQVKTKRLDPCLLVSQWWLFLIQFRHDLIMFNRLSGLLHEHAEHEWDDVLFYLPQLINLMVKEKCC